jgi:heavy metal sensor kinase
VNARVPIRWRLTLWYALLFALTMALFAAGLYGLLQRRLQEAFDEQLADQASLVLSVIQGDDGELVVRGEIDPREDGLLVRVFDVRGAIVAATTDVPLDDARQAELVAAALRGSEAFTDLWFEHERLRVVTTPIRAGGAFVGVLQVGQSPDDVDEALAEVISVLAATAPVALVVAVGAGYYLAGSALRPVTRITDLAASIGGDDLHARLDLPLPDDEVGRLARTFDGMLARIEDAFERQKQFTGDAAHELRTPLSLMRSQIDLALARPRSNAEYQAALRALDGDLARLTGLVSTLLTLARADAGRLTVEREPFDLAATVALVLDQYAAVAAERGVALREATGPTPVSADEDLLVQALVNLLDNALRHTPAGGTVTAGCRRAGDAAELWVVDTGEGIPSHYQPRVFDRFYRVHPASAGQSGGAGLGLAICLAIAQAHGGTIAIDSAPGAGTRITLRFPSGAADNAAPALSA